MTGRMDFSMKSLISLAVCLIAVGAPAFSRADEVVVKLKSGADASSVALKYGAKVAGRAGGSDVYLLTVPAGSTADAFSVRVRKDSRVTIAEPNLASSAPEMRGGQVHMAFDAGGDAAGYVDQAAYGLVGLNGAGALSTGSGVIVAVVDTGVAVGHAALQQSLVPGFNAINPSATPTDLPDGATNAAVGHGTMIAGIIARIAPAAKIMPVRVLNGDGVGDVFTVVSGIQYAMDHGARVMNLSLGSTTPSPTLEDIVGRAESIGILVVASAGNDGSTMVHYPGKYGSAIAVASVEQSLTRSAYSNYGDISVAAPGTGIRSTYWDGGYATWSGTSFSAPFVSGEAALILSLRPDLKASEARSYIEGSAHPVTGSNGNNNNGNSNNNASLGHGLIDILGALTAARK